MNITPAKKKNYNNILSIEYFFFLQLHMTNTLHSLYAMYFYLHCFVFSVPNQWVWQKQIAPRMSCVLNEQQSPLFQLIIYLVVRWKHKIHVFRYFMSFFLVKGKVLLSQEFTLNNANASSNMKFNELKKHKIKKMFGVLKLIFIEAMYRNCLGTQSI